MMYIAKRKKPTAPDNNVLSSWRVVQRGRIRFFVFSSRRNVISPSLGNVLLVPFIIRLRVMSSYTRSRRLVVVSARLSGARSKTDRSNGPVKTPYRINFDHVEYIWFPIRVRMVRKITRSTLRLTYVDACCLVTTGRATACDNEHRGHCYTL